MTDFTEEQYDKWLDSATPEEIVAFLEANFSEEEILRNLIQIAVEDS